MSADAQRLAADYRVWWAAGDSIATIRARIAAARGAEDHRLRTLSRGADRTMHAECNGSIYRGES